MHSHERFLVYDVFARML